MGTASRAYETRGRRLLAVVGALAIAGAALIAAAGLSGCAAASGGSDAGITVTASSDVKVTPDKARIGLSVTNESADAAKCQEENGAAVDAVVQALRDAGVQDADIQTTDAYLSTNYDNDGNPDGYSMTTSLRVGGLDIGQVSSVSSACVKAGATGLDGLEYYSSGYDEAYEQAMQDALAAAETKAQGIADASGLGLGGIVDVVEGAQDDSTRYTALAGGGDVASDAQGKLMPGQLSVSAQVTVTYAIS